MNNIFSVTEIGASHIKCNKECQDASATYYDGVSAVIVVSDGHGGDDYVRSAIGSATVCEVLVGVWKTSDLRRKLLTAENYQKDIYHITTYLMEFKNKILTEWRHRIHKHFEDNPITPEELEKVSERARCQYEQGERIEKAYGCTLIGAMATRLGCVYLQIGDGVCVTKTGGEYRLPLPEDESCQFNITTSMCDVNAEEKIRIEYSEKLPDAIFLSSDGVENSFVSAEYMHKFFDTVHESARDERCEEMMAELKGFLGRLSKKGSGDDMSVACMFLDETFFNSDSNDKTVRLDSLKSEASLQHDNQNQENTQSKVIEPEKTSQESEQEDTKTNLDENVNSGEKKLSWWKRFAMWLRNIFRRNKG